MIKKPNIFILMVVMMALSMSSCVEEFEIVDKDFESKLVVNALFDSDSPWQVEITQTAQAFDPDANLDKISFAKVEIFDQNNEFLYELHHQGDGIYGNEDYGPSPKRAYGIKVTAPGFRVVTAKGYVPEKSRLLINNFSIIQNDDQNDVEVDFEIEDKSKLESYYIWEVVNIIEDDNGNVSSIGQFSDTWIDELTSNPNELVNKDREFLGNGSFGNGIYNGSYSSADANRRIANSNPIVGTSSSTSLSEDIKSSIKMNPLVDDGIDLDADSHNLEDDIEIFEEDDEQQKVKFKYELRVMTISRELYEYYSSFEEYYQNGGNSHSNEAPFILYTNVKNGAGIFAGFSESVIQF